MAIICCIKTLQDRDMSVEEFRSWLARFDLNHDGGISREELKKALHSLHAWCAWWKARKVMKEADTNRNGKIDKSKDEMDKLVSYAQKKLHMRIYETGW